MNSGMAWYGMVWNRQPHQIDTKREKATNLSFWLVSIVPSISSNTILHVQGHECVVCWVKVHAVYSTPEAIVLDYHWPVPIRL